MAYYIYLESLYDGLFVSVHFWISLTFHKVLLFIYIKIIYKIIFFRHFGFLFFCLKFPKNTLELVKKLFLLIPRPEVEGKQV